MLAQRLVGVEPRHRGQLPRGGVGRELLPPSLLARGVLDELECVPGVVAPAQPSRVELRRQRRLVVQGRPGLGAVALRRVVDERRVGHDQHEVVRGRRTRHVGVVVVAERELARVVPVMRDVLLLELDAGRGGVAGQPGGMTVVGILRRWVRAVRQGDPAPAGKRPEIIVVAVVLLDDDDDVLDRARHTQRPALLDHSSWTAYEPSLLVFHAQMSPISPF